MNKWASILICVFVCGCGGGAPASSESRTDPPGSANSAGASRKSTRIQRRTDWTACDLVSAVHAEPALGGKVESVAGNASPEGSERASACAVRGPNGAGSIETHVYTDEIGATKAFDARIGEDSKDSTYRVIQGLGDRAYAVQNRIRIKSSDVQIVLSFDASGGDAEEAYRIRRAVAGGTLSRLAHIHPAVGREIPDNEIPSF